VQKGILDFILWVSNSISDTCIWSLLIGLISGSFFGILCYKITSYIEIEELEEEIKRGEIVNKKTLDSVLKASAELDTIRSNKSIEYKKQYEDCVNDKQVFRKKITELQNALDECKAYDRRK